MVSRYVPDTGDLIWVDFDPTKVASKPDIVRLLS